MSTPADDDASRAFARSALWRVAAAILGYPDAEGDRARAAPWEAAGRAVGRVGDADLAPRFEAVRAAFEAAGRDAIEEAYTAAFGHTVHSSLPPYETEWGEREGLLQPHRIADLAASYRLHGLDPAPSGERADHVAVECEFLHFLTYKEGYARIRGDGAAAASVRSAETAFLRNHLARFGPAFAAKLRRSDPDGPFGAAAAYLQALVAREAAELGIPLGKDDLSVRTVSFDEEAAPVRCSSPEPSRP